jgi:isocitrate lyase
MATRNAERRALRDGAPCSHCETLGPLGKVCATCRDGKHLVPKRA